MSQNTLNEGKPVKAYYTLANFRLYLEARSRIGERRFQFLDGGSIIGLSNF